MNFSKQFYQKYSPGDSVVIPIIQSPSNGVLSLHPGLFLKLLKKCKDKAPIQPRYWITEEQR